MCLMSSLLQPCMAHSDQKLAPWLRFICISDISFPLAGLFDFASFFPSIPFLKACQAVCCFQGKVLCRSQANSVLRIS